MPCTCMCGFHHVTWAVVATAGACQIVKACHQHHKRSCAIGMHILQNKTKTEGQETTEKFGLEAGLFKVRLQAEGSNGFSRAQHELFSTSAQVAPTLPHDAHVLHLVLTRLLCNLVQFLKLRTCAPLSPFMQVLTSKDEGEAAPGTPSKTDQAKQLLAQYGSAYLITSISFAIVSFALCYLAVDSGVPRAPAYVHAHVVLW